MKLTTRYKWLSFSIILLIYICTCPSHIVEGDSTAQESHSCSSNTHANSNDSTTSCEKCPNKSNKISEVNQSYIICAHSNYLISLDTPKSYWVRIIFEDFIIERPPPLSNIRLNC